MLAMGQFGQQAAETWLNRSGQIAASRLALGS
jgi:hypothetical protein